MSYDVFLSFKNTTPNGSYTVDRIIAEQLHKILCVRGIRVFFSEKEIINAAFMDQIYRALDDAKLLILIGTSAEHIHSEWVKSEWQSFLGAMHSGRKPDAQLITVLQGMSTRELPIEISCMQSFNAVDIDKIVDFVLITLNSRTKQSVSQNNVSYTSGAPGINGDEKRNAFKTKRILLIVWLIVVIALFLLSSATLDNVGFSPYQLILFPVLIFGISIIVKEIKKFFMNN